MTDHEPTIRVRLDPCNPGQFFACCGLLELADRLWNGAEGWFDLSDNAFCIASLSGESSDRGGDLIESLAQCELGSTLPSAQVQRRDELALMKQKDRSAPMEAEKKELDRLWREEPLVFQSPFHLQVDWWRDDLTGGSRFKTWAGQQSVIEIARAMKQPIEQGGWRDVAIEDWLGRSGGSGVPFNFDSDLGGQSSDLDVGFSLDPLGMGSRKRPLIELAAFIGLQRFRPASDPETKTYIYTLWPVPLMPAVAAVAACGHLELPNSRRFAFRLLFRTKYLKSFLPAKPIGDNP